jgi:hypothetical protein
MCLMSSPKDTEATAPAATQIFETSRQYEQYLELTKPTLLQPTVSSHEYVRSRARHTPPLGFVMVRPSES